MRWLSRGEEHLGRATSGSTPRGSGARPPRRSRSRARSASSTCSSASEISCCSAPAVPRAGELVLVEDPEAHRRHDIVVGGTGVAARIAALDWPHARCDRGGGVHPRAGAGPRGGAPACCAPRASCPPGRAGSSRFRAGRRDRLAAPLRPAPAVHRLPLEARDLQPARGRREVPRAGREDRARRLRRPGRHRRHRGPHVVGRRLRDGAGPPVRARAVSPRHHADASPRSLGRDRTSTTTDRAPGLLHAGRARRPVRRAPAALRSRFDAYRDGINAWIDHVQSSPTDMPGEFAALGITVPTPGPCATRSPSASTWRARSP